MTHSNSPKSLADKLLEAAGEPTGTPPSGYYGEILNELPSEEELYQARNRGDDMLQVGGSLVNCYARGGFAFYRSIDDPRIECDDYDDLVRVFREQGLPYDSGGEQKDAAWRKGLEAEADADVARGDADPNTGDNWSDEDEDGDWRKAPRFR